VLPSSVILSSAEIERVRKAGIIKSPIFLLDADVDTNRAVEAG
jgi:hypothetical protein